jgi:hypothetical protein
MKLLRFETVSVKYFLPNSSNILDTGWKNRRERVGWCCTDVTSPLYTDK